MPFGTGRPAPGRLRAEAWRRWRGGRSRRPNWARTGHRIRRHVPSIFNWAGFQNSWVKGFDNEWSHMNNDVLAYHTTTFIVNKAKSCHVAPSLAVPFLKRAHFAPGTLLTLNFSSPFVGNFNSVRDYFENPGKFKIDPLCDRRRKRDGHRFVVARGRLRHCHLRRKIRQFGRCQNGNHHD